MRTALVLGRHGDMWGWGAGAPPSVTCETLAAGTPYLKGLLSEVV